MNNSIEESTQQRRTDTVYCHFSFKRPKNIPGYGYFAVAFYFGINSKKPTAQKTVKLPLWKDHQFITAIQSYEFALSCIADWQGLMKKNGITQVLLVTDNSTLAGWIENPKKNKAYKDYMVKAVSRYRAGGPREIVLGIGLCDVLKYEKSYKYCKEEYIKEEKKEVKTIKSNGKNLIDISQVEGGYKTASAIVSEDISMPEII